MTRSLQVLIALSSAFVSCSDNDAVHSEQFVGSWIVTQADHDGIIVEEWVGTHLSIQQTEINIGIYSMTDTKNDSIWSSNGTWTKSLVEQELILDDTVTANIYYSVDRLTIVKLLPWTSSETCENDICLPMVTGFWNFELEKDR